MSSHFSFLSFLFPFYPREVSKYRRVVYSEKQALRYIRMANGIHDVFISLYDLNYHIDKIWFEIDTTSIEKATEEAKRIRDSLNEHGIDPIIVFSGAKGFHFYIPIKEWRPPNLSTANVVLRDIARSLSYNSKYLDRYSNLRQLVRVPNTKNLKTGSYATFVYEDFSVSWLKRQHPMRYMPKRLDIKKLYDISGALERYNEQPIEFLKAPRVEISNNICEFLRNLIRPCVVEYLCANDNPAHDIRTDLVSELMWLGFSKEDIVKVIERLKWRDYNYDITMYHINKIFEKRLLPLSCKKLSQYVRCTHCGWFYFWTTGGGR